MKKKLTKLTLHVETISSPAPHENECPFKHKQVGSADKFCVYPNLQFNQPKNKKRRGIR
jgi:hypothetical protein